MKQKNWLVVGLIIATMLLLIGGYTLLSGVKEDFTPIPTNSSVENSTVYFLGEKDRHINTTDPLVRLNISFDKVPHNTKPNFKVGDKFEYIAHGLKISKKGPDYRSQSTQKIVYSVVGKEKLRGVECYVVESVNLFLVNGSDIMSSGTISKNVYYMGVETGKIMSVTSIKSPIRKGIEMNKTEYSADLPSEVSEIYRGLIIYSPWMLSLKDEFKMEIKIYYPEVEKEEIKVIDKDIIKNRECFIVESRTIDENNKILSREKMWVDVEKRILIKSEVYYENLKINELEIVSELK